MYFLNCYHPVRIVKYGVERFVPCGKCDYCKHVRNSSMSQRISQEMKCHKYNVFVTLTYANTFIPKFSYVPGLNALIKDSDKFLHGAEDSGMFIDTSNFSDRELNHVCKMINTCGFLPVLDRKDVQLFIKRLRRFIDYNIVRPLLNHGKITQAQKQEFGIYYTFIGEYGPQNFRPHMHGIISFEKKELALAFHRLLSKSWPFGRCTYKFTQSEKHAKYISQYVNATYRLPEFYQRSEIRPFRLFSKSHPVGLPAINKEEIQRIFHNCSPTMFYKDERGVQRECPLWSCIENRLFPRFIAYNQIDDNLRIEIIKDALTFDSFKDYVRSKAKYNDLPFQPSDYCIGFHSPFNDFFTLINKEIQDITDKSRLFNSALYSIYHSSNIIGDNMVTFHISSVKDYVSKINRYLFNLEQFKLKNQFQFENIWYNNHPDWLQYLNLGSYSIDDILKNTSDMDKIFAEIKYYVETSHKNRSKTDCKSCYPSLNFDKYITSSTFSGLDNY